MNYEQLKNSILQEAIEGLLVPQDPNDESAAVLLDRIADEKKRLIKEKKIKRDRNESRIYRTNDGHWMERFSNKNRPEVCIDDEIPFDIPESWEWCRASILFEVKGGKRLPIGAQFSEVPTKHVYIRVTDMKNHSIVNYNLKYISEELYQKLSRYTINKEDLYLTIAGTIGYCGIVPEEFNGMNLTENAVKLTYLQADKMYIFYTILSSYVQSQFLDKTNQLAQPKLAIRRIQTTLIPLPPLSEQHRIVSKLEEVLPKVEEYGKAQDRLDTLNSVLPEKLKASILQEAIEGRLVPQNPDDEPASELLDRIAEEKAKLVKEKKIKADKNASRIYRTDDGHWMEHFADKRRTDVCIDDDIPFDIPSNWRWSRLKEHCVIASGLGYKKENLETKSEQMIRVLRGGNIDYGKWQNKVNDIFISKEFVKDELLLKRGTFISPAVTSLEQMGKTALIEEDLPETVVGGFVLMITPFIFKDEYLHYLNAFFMSSYYKKQCQSITNKSGQAFYNLSRAKLLETLLPVPPIQEERRIVNLLNEMLPKLDTLK